MVIRVCMLSVKVGMKIISRLRVTLSLVNKGQAIRDSSQIFGKSKGQRLVFVKN